MITRLKISCETVIVIDQLWQRMPPHPINASNPLDSMVASVLNDLQNKFEKKASDLRAKKRMAQLKPKSKCTINIKYHEAIALTALLLRQLNIAEDNNLIYEQAHITPVFSALNQHTCVSFYQLESHETIVI